MNKARLFDNDVKAEGQLLAEKIITILVNFRRKMETTLGEILKLLFKSQTEGPSRPSLPSATPQKEKQCEELRTCLQQLLVKKSIPEVAKVEIPPLEVPTATPIAV